MNDEADSTPQQEPPPEGGGETPPSEEELRQRIEEGLRSVRVQDVLLESVVTLVNLAARRIGKEDERDLEQARLGIEAVRSLVGLLDAEPRAQVQNALSELQVLYARHAGGDGGAKGEGTSPEEGPKGPSPTEPRKGGPGLWTPPGS